MKRTSIKQELITRLTLNISFDLGFNQFNLVNEFTGNLVDV